MPHMLFIVEPVGQREERGVDNGRVVYQQMLDFTEELRTAGVLMATSSLATAATRLRRPDGAAADNHLVAFDRLARVQPHTDDTSAIDHDPLDGSMAPDRQVGPFTGRVQIEIVDRQAAADHVEHQAGRRHANGPHMVVVSTS